MGALLVHFEGAHMEPLFFVSSDPPKCPMPAHSTGLCAKLNFLPVSIVTTLENLYYYLRYRQDSHISLFFLPGCYR